MRPGLTGGPGPGVTPEPGAVVFDRYRLLTLVGSGSTSTVWKAHDELLHETVALKRIPFAHLDPTQARLTRDRTLREARLAAKLRHHPHVVAIYDILLDTTDLWLVTEYLPARSLRDHLATHGPLHPTHAATIGAHIADALAAAHDRGITHRDIKPANVMLTDNGTVKLTDFGIAHHEFPEPPELTELADPGTPGNHLTAAGTISGTVAYMAPETARTGHTDPTTDIYSLGATLYTAVEGTPPYGYGTNDTQLLHLVSNGIIRPPTPGAPLTPLLHRLLQTLPTTRPDAHTTRDLLHRHTTTHPHDEVFVPAGTASTGGQHIDPGSRTRPSMETGPSLPPIVLLDAVGTGPGTGPSRPTEVTTATAPRTGTGRTRRVAMLAAAGLTALALVLGVGAFGTETVRGDGIAAAYTGVPELPSSVAPVVLDVAAPDLDLCPLLPPAWLTQYGQPTLTDAYRIDGCEAEIRTERGIVYVNISVGDSRQGLETLSSDTTDLGGMGVARLPRDGDQCVRYVWLADNHHLYIQGREPPGGLDPCLVADTVVGAAVAELDANGFHEVPGRTGDVQIADADACTVGAGTAASVVPGLVGDPRPGFGGWTCLIGTGSTTVEIGMRLYSTAPGDTFGVTADLQGMDGRFEVRPGEDGSTRCMLTIERRPWTSTSPAELFVVTVTGPGGPVPTCEQASMIATAALPGLPSS